MFRILGLLMIAPAAVLLTLSFFVMFTIRKVELNSLKAYGRVVSAVLCLAATIVLLIAIYILITGKNPLMPVMYPMPRQWGAMPMTGSSVYGPAKEGRTQKQIIPPSIYGTPYTYSSKFGTKQEVQKNRRPAPTAPKLLKTAPLANAQNPPPSDRPQETATSKETEAKGQPSKP